ncbi:hypothetical protein [Blastomonas sp.]|uniref:hypothetical protein n=1 Tax=Blastomonas sp. TaxID=1909299 RepID=UPI00406A85AC
MIMKDSDDWFRQKAVDQAADETAAERGCGPEEVKPYQVAKKLGIEKPGGDFYEKVYDWRRRRQAETSVTGIEVPVEASVAFRAALDQFSNDAMVEFARTVRAVGGTIDQAASLRVAAAERSRDGSEAERMDLLGLCRQVEAERDAALVQVAELTRELTDVRRQVDLLTGRLQQRAIDAAAMLAGRQLASETSESHVEPDAADVTASAAGETQGPQTEMALPMAAAATADDPSVATEPAPS